MIKDVKCEDTLSASETLMCSNSSRCSSTSECDGIELDTDSGTSNDRTNYSSHSSTSDESADTRKNLINLRITDESNENLKTNKFSIYSKCLMFMMSVPIRQSIADTLEEKK